MSELPDGWIKTPFMDVFDIQGGTQPPKSVFEYHPQEGYVRLLQIRDFGDKPLATYVPVKTTLKRCTTNDVLIGRYGASVGRICTGMEGAYNVALAKVVIPEVVDKKFVAYLLKSELFQRPILDIERSAQDGFNKEDLSEISLPIAPETEQRRIVAKLEKLFSHVDAAQARLATIPRFLKRFRKSVLAAACSGRLTADWRELHPETNSASEALTVHAQHTANRARNTRRLKPAKGLTLIDYSEQLPETWVWLKVRHLVERGAIFDVQDGNHGELYPRADDFGKVGVPYISAENVINDRVQLDSAPRLRYEKAKQLRIGFAKANDVVLTHNATVGRVAVLPSDSPNVVLSTSTTYYRVDDAVLLPSYLAIFLRSHYFQSQLETVMEQTTRNQVSVTKQVELGIALPTIAEQQEIVRRVEALFRTADAFETRYLKAKTHVDKLTQSILAKAFRGELVAQDPADEPASVLLERIRAQRNGAQTKKRVATNRRGGK